MQRRSTMLKNPWVRSAAIDLFNLMMTPPIEDYANEWEGYLELLERGQEPHDTQVRLKRLDGATIRYSRYKTYEEFVNGKNWHDWTESTGSSIVTKIKGGEVYVVHPFSSEEIPGREMHEYSKIDAANAARHAREGKSYRGYWKGTSVPSFVVIESEKVGEPGFEEIDGLLVKEIGGEYSEDYHKILGRAIREGLSVSKPTLGAYRTKRLKGFVRDIREILE